MSYSITISGEKGVARIAAADQSDANIKNGYQTIEQKAMVIAIIDACTGSYVSGSISGHNDLNSNNIAVSITSHSPADVRPNDPRSTPRVPS